MNDELRGKNGTCFLNVIVRKHVVTGAPIEHLLPLTDADDGIGEALCGACYARPPKARRTIDGLVGIASRKELQ